MKFASSEQVFNFSCAVLVKKRFSESFYITVIETTCFTIMHNNIDNFNKAKKHFDKIVKDIQKGAKSYKHYL